MGQKESHEKKKLENSTDDFRQQLIKLMIVICESIPKDLIIIIANYLSIPYEFEILSLQTYIHMHKLERTQFLFQRFHNLCGGQHDSPRNCLEYINKHVIITNTKIKVIQYSIPWIVIPVRPSLLPGCKFKINCPSFDMEVYIVKKNENTKQIGYYIGYRCDNMCNTTKIHQFFGLGSIQVVVERQDSNDCIVLTRRLSKYAEPDELITRKFVPKGTVDEYSVMISCGFQNQLIEIES